MMVCNKFTLNSFHSQNRGCFTHGLCLNISSQTSVHLNSFRDILRLDNRTSNVKLHHADFLLNAVHHVNNLQKPDDGLMDAQLQHSRHEARCSTAARTVMEQNNCTCMLTCCQPFHASSSTSINSCSLTSIHRL